MITVSVSLPVYLAQWAFCNLDSEQSGASKVIIPKKGSPIAQFLRNFLRHKRFRPISQAADPNRGAVKEGVMSIQIAVPHFPGRDPQYYNYLSPVAEAQLRDLLRSQLDLMLYTDFSRMENINVPLNEFISSWLDSNGIDDDERNWLAVEKRLQLLRRRALDRQRKNR